MDRSHEINSNRSYNLLNLPRIRKYQITPRKKVYHLITKINKIM